MMLFSLPLFPLVLLLNLPMSHGWSFLLLSFGLGLGVGLIWQKYGRLGRNIAPPQFQSVFEFAPVGMAQLSQQGTVLRVNPALCNLLDCETEQLIDHLFTDWIHPLERESFAQHIQTLIKTQTPITAAEQRCLNNQDQLVHTILSAHLRQDGHGQPQSIFITLQDISTRKQIELALQEQKQYLRLIIDNIPQQVFWKDTNSVFLGCNKNWAAAAGLEHPNKVVGKTDFDLLPDPKVAEYYRSQDRIILETNRPELHIVASKERPGDDGQVVWLDINRVPIHDQEGQVVGVLGVLEDITQRRQAEAAIRESEALLNATFSQAAIGIAHQNEAGCCLKVNQRYCDIFDYSAQDLLDLSFQALSYPADLEPDASQYQALWAGEINTYTLEKRCIRQDGQTVWCNKTVSLTYDAQGIPRYATVILEDISDRIQAAIELQKAKDSAEQANRAKSDFLAKMSHELRTPLNAILGFTQLLQRQVNLTPPQQEHLGIINRSGEHLLTLINDILDLAKIEARRMPINPNPFDLEQFLARLDEMLRLRAETQGLQLHIERANTIPRYINTDEGKLRQVLINLLGNALKFTFEGEVTLIVTATVVEHQDALSFTIADTGVGIPAHEIAKLFAPFEQTTSGEATGQGTGLGLAISQQFVRLMGGEITVQSVVGQGSRFEFTIPVQQCQASDLSSGTTSPSVLHLMPNQPEYRLLIVDDSLEHCHALGELLSDVGFTVKIVTGGANALHLWRTFAPHLIWMDAQMPEIDGYEVTRQVRAVELAEHLTPTKIIALTARVFEADRSLALAAGCDDFVQKPFDETTILTKLSEHLGVNYCYGQFPNSYSENSRSELPESEPNIILTTAQHEQLQTVLHQMPTAWREALQMAACQCDHALVLPLVEKMPSTTQVLQKYLLHCLEQYRFDHIVDLFKEALAVRS